MMKVKNETNIYCVIEMGDMYIDTNGCYYKNLTSKQMELANKKYYFEISKNEESITLSANQIILKVVNDEIVIKKQTAARYTYKGKQLITEVKAEKLDKIYKYSINNVEFLSFLTLILMDKPYYDQFVEWMTFVNSVSNIRREEDKKYLLVFKLFLNNQDGIIAELLSKNMFGTLYDFLYYRSNKVMSNTEYHMIFKLAYVLESKYRQYLLGQSLVKDEAGTFIELLEKIVDAYGKEPMSSILKFIQILNKMNESTDDDRIYKLIYEILVTLYYIKDEIPNSKFDENINYIIKKIFRDYEGDISLNGFLHIAKLWLDYLIMKNVFDPTYPKQLIKDHNKLAQKMNSKTGISCSEMIINFRIATKRYKELEYASETHRIRIPNNIEELKEVGKRLHNCVGSYADAIISQRSKILWLCKDDNIPIVAIEVNNHDVVQAKRCGNNEPYKEEADFIQIWCEEKELNFISY